MHCFKYFRELTWQMLDVVVEVLNQHWMNWTNWTMNSWICLWFFWLRFWLTKSLSLHRQRSLPRRNPRHRPCGLLFSSWCFFDVTLLTEYSFCFWQISQFWNKNWLDTQLTQMGAKKTWNKTFWTLELQNNIYFSQHFTGSSHRNNRTGKWVIRLHVKLKVIRLQVELKVMKRDKHLQLNWTKKISTICRMRTK